MFDIEKAAREYVVNKCSWANSCCFDDGVGCPNCAAPYKVFMTFIYEAYKASHNSRQPEIDELRKGLEDLCAVVGKLNDTNIKKHYSKLVIAYDEAKKLLESTKIQ